MVLSASIGTHHALHALGSRIFGFSQELYQRLAVFR
jgi:hypothetical protein